MIGSRLGRYEITAKLGEGGMGEVFRARDSRLNRDVALKVLPAGMGAEPDRLERFRREAQAVAALNHPNIVTLFSFEESDEVCFLTMELVEGAALDKLIPPGGFDLESWLEIGAALADAVAAAHARGIIHRDLKPANIMIGGGGGTGERRQVKVLDFGLARMTETEAPASAPTLLTREGAVMGTLPYMSPEQVRGVPLDERTDLFSLGVILYEMATGHRPFRGETSAELGSAILRDPPPPMSERREALPADVERILRRCLEKDRRDRMPSARSLHDELRLLRRDLAARAPLPRADSGASRAADGFRVAVLPFKSSGDADMNSFADGLGEEIATGLSRFQYLSVVAGAPGADLGARYALEGSIRKGGSFVRVSAQLVDIQSGARLWAETYNRDLQAASIFSVQDDVAARIVATVADSYGVLVRSAMRSVMRQKDDADLTSVEWQFQYFAYREQITPASHAALEGRLERALARNGRQSEMWACLAQIYVDQYAFGFRADAASLDRALAAARRAVELDRANQFALVSLAQAHFFRRDLAAFGPAAERAMALNPLNTDAVGILGLQIVHTGEFERGTAIVLRAMELNPNHAGWMHFAPLWNHFHKGEYEQALERANRVDVPGLFWPFLVVAAACGHLGRRAEAEAAVRDILALDPEFAAHARQNIESWHFASGLLEPLVEGLRKAGLNVPDPARAEPSERAGEPVAAVAIAVLPFTDMSPARDQEYLCEGMAEEIMSALVRVDGLRVAARTSAFRAQREGGEPRAIGARLGVGLILEGSVRTAGERLRATAQLIEVESGFQLWSERFDRETADLFAVQDEIAAGVVEAVKVRLAPGARAAPARPQPANLEAYRIYLKGRSLRGKEHHAEALRAFEEAVRLDPSHAPSWTGLAEITVLAAAFGMIPPRHACATAREALATAMRLQGESAEGRHVEGFVAWIECRWQAMEIAWRRAIELQPSHVLSLASFGIVLCTRQRLEEALPFFERAREADPLASFPYALTGMGHLNCGLPREAERYLEDALAFEKEDATALDSSGMAKVALGRVEEGIATLEQVVAVSHRAPHFLGTLGWALATAGRTSEARTLLVELRSRSSEAPTLVSEAWLLGALGEIDAAFDVCARAEEECQAYLYFTGLPGFDPLRADPRFAALENRLGLIAPKGSPP